MNFMIQQNSDNRLHRSKVHVQKSDQKARQPGFGIIGAVVLVK